MIYFRESSFSVLGMVGLCIFLSGCPVDATSITGPFSVIPGKVVAFTVLGKMTDAGNDAGPIGIVPATSAPKTGGGSASGKKAVLALYGGISGTVTDGAGGLGNIIAQAFDGNCSFVNDAATNPDGTYQIGGLAAGSYRIQFYDPANVFVMEWYNDKPACSIADPVTVITGMSSSGKNAVLSCGFKDVMLCDTSNCFPYDRIQDAYNVTDNGESVKAHSFSFDEDLVLINDTNITLVGGFDCPFGSESSFTTIKSLSLIAGSVEIKNFIIK